MASTYCYSKLHDFHLHLCYIPYCFHYLYLDIAVHDAVPVHGCHGFHYLPEGLNGLSGIPVHQPLVKGTPVTVLHQDV